MGEVGDYRRLCLYHNKKMKRGKKYKAVAEKVEKNKLYTAEEALALVRETKTAKFDEAVEVHIRLAVDPKKGDQQVRGAVVLPHGIGKAARIAVITSTKATEAKEAGADFVGAEDLIEKIKLGKMEEVDVIVASPEMMPKLASVAKILGPRGLMPSPKTETVTDKIKEAVEMLKKGKLSFKNDNTGNVHQVIGKVSFDAKKLEENYAMFVDAIQKARPSGIKGKYVMTISICSTMGPGIKIAL
ncbi:MAG: 50S ribosomal protein L1 [Candidatus Moranbacteria bacterium GW2011_GWC2_37_73]|nr:MAG: 50S ribosomal protein L1 [Parcubacteria group bacterium GW2011_GWC1_36_108]KKQ00051.1 MAG: 50S ribosomal protein L1 [Candidatus Moranbacteria bacterium GW2011_GWD2_36_198]KKQ40056.1 MAG: 50S ribosomal protein L1 [Candidatus Moranbacteria bacterium GW2011_GWC2_37_73]